MRLVLVAALALAACSKEKKVELDPESSLFTEEDLTAGARVTPIEGKEIGSTVASSGALEASGGGFTLKLTDAADTCVQDKIDALTLSASEGNVRLKETVDFLPCFDAGEDDVFKIAKASVTLMMWVGCEDESLKDYDGKTVAEADGLSAKGCAGEGDASFIYNVDSSFAISATFGAHEMYSEIRGIDAMQTQGGKPCDGTFTGDGDDIAWKDSCRVVSRNVNVKATVDGTATDEEGSESYLSLDFHDVVQGDKDPWFKAGSFAIRLNDWTGTITNTGANTPPTYVLTSSTGETKSGTVGDYDGGAGLDQHTADANRKAAELATATLARVRASF